MLVASMFTVAILSFQINIPTFLIAWIAENDISTALAHSKPSLLSSIITAIASIFFASLIVFVGISGIRNYKGPVRSSEWDARNADENTLPLPLQLIISDLKYLLKPNAILYQKGKDPYTIEPVSSIVNWDQLTLDLLLASNKDFNANTVEWSDSDKCHIIKKRDYVTHEQKLIYLLPSQDNRVSEQIVSIINRIGKNKNEADEIIVCLEDRVELEVKQKTDCGIEFEVTNRFQLIEKSIDLRTYAKSILQRFQHDIALRYHLENPGSESKVSELTLEQTYTKLRVSPRNDQKDGTINSVDLETMINEWLTLKASPQLSILGEFGQGKSTAMLAFSAKWAENYLKRYSDNEHGEITERVPLLIELRSRSPKDKPTPIDILGDWGHQHGLSGEQLYNLVKARMAILVFEGFDEVKNAGRKIDRYQQFNALWQFAFNGSKIIFTGRPNFFLDEAERIQFLNAHADTLGNGTNISNIYTLNFMNLDDIKKALSRVDKNLTQEIIATAKNDPTLMDIVKRPSMLPVIVSQWNKIKAKEEITSSQIVRSYIEATYKRKDEEIVTRGKYQLLPWEIRHFVTQALVLDMISRGDKNTTTSENIDSVVKRIEKYFDSVFLNKESDPKLVDAITELNLKKNTVDITYEDYIKIISTDIRSNGLLVPDPANGAKSFYFPHKQYYEYILGETYASFYTYPRSLVSLALNSFQGIKHKHLTTAAYLEPMLLQYFAGLCTPEMIEKMEPEIDYNKYLKIIKPFWNAMIRSSYNFNNYLDFIEFNLFKSIDLSIPVISNYRALYHVAVAHTLSVLMFPLITSFVILGRGNMARTRRVKFALMKYRCTKDMLDAEYPNGRLREILDEWFSQTFKSNDPEELDKH